MLNCIGFLYPFTKIMMMINKNTIKIGSKIVAIALITLLMNACSKCSDNKDITQTGTDDLPDNDTVKAVGLNIGGQLFSIPSPMQTAMLIQKSGISYDKSILNAGNKNGQYTTDLSMSLNLGVYGADLGYVSMYNQTQDALGYFGAVKQLADKIGVSAAFDQALIKRINDNISIKDSMLMLVGVAYRASDAYLKTNKRTEISSLILTGGWIESMHFSISAFKQKSNNEFKQRIAEQKQALSSIIALLSSHGLESTKNLIAQLEDLAKVYEGVTSTYTFVEPVTDEAKKITYINSTTQINISEDQLKQISEKINTIRESIINSKS